MLPSICNFSINFSVTGLILKSSDLFVGFSNVKIVVVFAPGSNVPPYQLVIGNVFSATLSFFSPKISKSNKEIGLSITFLIFENDSLLCTRNFPPSPFTTLTAVNAFTSPVP